MISRESVQSCRIIALLPDPISRIIKIIQKLADTILVLINC